MLPRLGSAFLAAVLLGGCAAWTDRPPCENLTLYKRELIRWHDAGHYDRAFAAAAARAQRILDATIRDRPPNAAIVFDIDETLLSNWAYLTQYDFSIAHPVFGPWVLGGNIDPPLTPMRQVFETARAARIPIFLVSGRWESLRDGTLRQLKAAGYSGWTTLYLRPNVYQPVSIIPFKSSARAAIEKQGYRIVLNVGDQWSDLEGGHAEHTVKLPNPFYLLP